MAHLEKPEFVTTHVVKRTVASTQFLSDGITATRLKIPLDTQNLLDLVRKHVNDIFMVCARLYHWLDTPSRFIVYKQFGAVKRANIGCCPHLPALLSFREKNIYSRSNVNKPRDEA